MLDKFRLAIAFAKLIWHFFFHLTQVVYHIIIHNLLACYFSLRQTKFTNSGFYFLVILESVPRKNMPIKALLCFYTRCGSIYLDSVLPNSCRDTLIKDVYLLPPSLSVSTSDILFEFISIKFIILNISKNETKILISSCFNF